jgi:hypothetical protein
MLSEGDGHSSGGYEYGGATSEREEEMEERKKKKERDRQETIATED